MQRWLIGLIGGLLIGAAFAQEGHVHSPYEDASVLSRPVSLKQLIADALEYNIPLQLSRLSAHLAEAQVDVAQGAFHPTLNASSSWAKQDLSSDLQTQGISNFRTQTYGVGIGQTWGVGAQLQADINATRRQADIVGLGSQSDYIANLNVSLRQPLLQGFGTANTSLKTAQLAQEAAQHRAERAVDEMIAQIANGYWALSEAEATERVLSKSVAVAESLLFRNNELYKRELASELDVLTAQSGLAIRQVNLIDAQQARQDAVEALIFSVYGDQALHHLTDLKTTPEDMPPPVLLDIETAETAALSRRSDAVAAQLELAQAQVFLKAAKNGLRPTLNLQSQLGTQGQAAGFGGAFDGLRNGFNGSIGLVFSQAMGNRSDRGRYRQALWQHEHQRLVHQVVENSVRQHVRASVRAVHSAIERLAQAEQAESFANRQLAAERKRLDLGLGDSFRVLQTEETVAQAELIAVRARFDLARAVMQYHLALGQLRAQYGQ